MRQGLLLIVFVALLPVVIAGFIQGMSAFKNTRNMAMERLSGHARSVAERERGSFVIAQHLLVALATNSDVQNITSKCDTALRNALSFAPVMNLARTAADGTVRCSVLPLKRPVNLTKELWWQRAINANGMTITKAPVFAQIAQTDALLLFLPLRDAEGKQNGTLSAAVDVRHLRQVLHEALEGKSGALAVVTKDAKIVAEGGRPLPFKPVIAGLDDHSRFADASDGKQWVYAFHRLYGSELFVVYAEPRQQLMAAAISQIRANILLPLISILLASLAIWLGTNRLALIWLRDLRDVAGRFAKGDFAGDRARFERAPEEIAALSADLHIMAEVIDHRNRDLTHALEAKSLLTREVHHRVKNNLQIINSLLTLQSGRVKEGMAKDVLAQTRARISALALIHRLLYEQDNGYEQGQVAIDNLLNELCAQLRSSHRSNRNVEFICDATNVPIPVDFAVPLTLFIVEGVTNALRHAFPDGAKGRINLNFAVRDDEAVLEITDNGRGYLVNDGVGQMGTELMYGFTTQVNGTLAISSHVGSGTKIELKFPMPVSPEVSVQTV